MESRWKTPRRHFSSAWKRWIPENRYWQIIQQSRASTQNGGGGDFPLTLSALPSAIFYSQGADITHTHTLVITRKIAGLLNFSHEHWAAAAATWLESHWMDGACRWIFTATAPQIKLKKQTKIKTQHLWSLMSPDGINEKAQRRMTLNKWKGECHK